MPRKSERRFVVVSIGPFVYGQENHITAMTIMEAKRELKSFSAAAHVCELVPVKPKRKKKKKTFAKKRMQSHEWPHY